MSNAVSYTHLPYMMVSSDLRIDEFKYEGSALGNWELGGVYLPGEAKDHHLDAYILSLIHI